MQEPNVKNGVGGLRDYHSLLWISYFKERINTTAKLVERRFLRDSERRALEKSYDFLLRVRTEMHYLTGSPLDGLPFSSKGGSPRASIFPRSISCFALKPSCGNISATRATSISSHNQ